jgi:hypothetical protein
MGDLETAEGLFSPIEFAIATRRHFDARQGNGTLIAVALELGNIGAIATLVAAGFRGRISRVLMWLCSSVWRQKDVHGRFGETLHSLGRVRRRVSELAPPFVAEVLQDSFRRADWRVAARKFVGRSGELDAEGSGGR